MTVQQVDSCAAILDIAPPLADSGPSLVDPGLMWSIPDKCCLTPDLVDLGRHLPILAQILGPFGRWATLVQHFARLGAGVGPTSAKFDPGQAIMAVRRELPQSCLTVAEQWPNVPYARVDSRTGPGFGRFGPLLGQRPTLASMWPDWAQLGRVGPHSANIGCCGPNAAKARSNSAQALPVWAFGDRDYVDLDHGFASVGPNWQASGRSRPNLA